MHDSTLRRATVHGLAFGLLLAAFACDDSNSGGQQPSTCTADQIADGTCGGDGTGGEGTDVDPSEGGDCTAAEAADGTKTITCSNGTTVSVSDGEKGDKGDKGDPGEDGQNGEMGEPGTPGRNAAAVGTGLKLEVQSVSIPEDLQPVVTLRMTDTNDQPLDRNGKLTPGAVSASFVFSKLTSADGKVGQYAPYSVRTITGTTVGSTPPAMETAQQPWYDNTGTWTELDPNAGTYSYRLAQVLPADYDQTKTHTLSAYGSRTFEGVQYISNTIFDMRPDGEEVSEHREIITTEGCNACHGALTLHGIRREMQLCVSCHVAGMNDPETGNSIDMKQMIHKIHSGASLPSVKAGTPYKILGYMNSVHDFSTVVFPQEKQNCVTCHTGPDGDRWQTEITRAACVSCHDLTSFTSPAVPPQTLHKGGAFVDDSRCLLCHAVGQGPIDGKEVDVVEVHKRLEELPLRNLTTGERTEPPKLAGEVLGVTGTGPDEVPVVTFKVTVDGEGYDILASGQALSRLRFTFAGPTTDYAGYAQFTAQGGSGSTPNVGVLAAAPGGRAGEFTWTPEATGAPSPPGLAVDQTMTEIATTCETVPEGSFAVGLEGRLTRPATNPNGTSVSVNYPMHNPVFYFAVTDDEAVPRREAVVVENCNNCHQDLAAHGGSRNDPEYCVLCHTANKDTLNVPPIPPLGETKLSVSVRLSHMIHRIHTGENGDNDYIIGSNDFSEVRFPADTRACTLCHVPAHYRLPLPELLPSRTWDFVATGAPSPAPATARVPDTEHYMGATSAACTGCHDSDDTVAHTELMTTAMGAESCTTCHATGSAYDVDVVHAIPGR